MLYAERDDRPCSPSWFLMFCTRQAYFTTSHCAGSGETALLHVD